MPGCKQRVRNFCIHALPPVSGRQPRRARSPTLEPAPLHHGPLRPRVSVVSGIRQLLYVVVAGSERAASRGWRSAFPVPHTTAECHRPVHTGPPARASFPDATASDNERRGGAVLATARAAGPTPGLLYTGGSSRIPCCRRFHSEASIAELRALFRSLEALVHPGYAGRTHRCCSMRKRRTRSRCYPQRTRTWRSDVHVYSNRPR